MCGFAGLYEPGGFRAKKGRARAREMAARLRHRGPDDEGVWTDHAAGIAFGFRRLSIIDLSSAGHQPMSSPSGDWTLVFNGEVYNFRDLRRELSERGWSFRGRSDTEVVLAAIETWGPRRAIRRFVGMFALAAWNANARELILARDRIGIKPLYYQPNTRSVIFGSELKALRACPEFEEDLDLDALASYLRYLYVPGPQTIFRNTFKLPPGHLLKFDPSLSRTPEPEPYWRVKEFATNGAGSGHAADDTEAVDRLEGLLRDAVEKRLVADVPLGALLSGGVDSSTVVALMQSLGGRTKTFTIGFDVEEHNEADHARRIARHLGTDHTELMLTGDDALGVVPSLPEIFDEPLADPSQIPTFLVSRLARRDVTVALSGDGGDELFGGYNRYVHGRRWIPRLRRVPRMARRVAAAGIGSFSSDAWDRVARVAHAVPSVEPPRRLAGEKLHKLGRLMSRDSSAEMYRSLLSVWDRPEGFVTSRVASDSDPVLEFLREGPAGMNLTDRMMLTDQRYYLPDDLLAKVDRASMATSLEVRVPILDHRVVEHSWGLADRFKIRNGRGKWILRQVLYRHVPRSLVDRPKMGFTAPVGEWLEGPLRPWAEDLLSDIADGELFRETEVRRAWNSFLEGHAQYGMGLWSILLFQAWRNHTPPA